MAKFGKFGSVQWQNTMKKTIAHKLSRGEEFTPQEKTFIHVQQMHNLRLQKEVRDRRAKMMR
jgi:hypothetical protein